MTTDNFTDDLLVRLINHRVTDEHSRKEDYLTECFAWLLENDYDMRSWFLKKGGPLFKDNKEKFAPERINDIKFNIETQKRLSNAGRPDITIEDKDNNFLLIVECKVDAPIDEGQLKRYLDAVKEKRNSSVLALVPEKKISSHNNSQLGSCFLGFFSWEEIAKIIPTFSSEREALELFRRQFLKLLEFYGLVQIIGQLKWIKKNGEQNINEALKICNGLNRIVTQVQKNIELANNAPRLYRKNNGLLNLTSAIQRSGKGSPPRPILCHSAYLSSHFDPFLKLNIVTYFSNPTHLLHSSEPLMGVSVLTLWEKLIKDDKEVGAIIIKKGKNQKNFSPKEISEIFEKLRQYVERIMRDFYEDIKDSDISVKTNFQLQTKPIYSHYLLLVPTKAMFPNNIQAEVALPAYEQWLCQVFESWFKAKPERILNDLFIDLML